MANKIRATKRGMGGSRNGKGRSEKTETMKRDSKKLRRAEGKSEAEAGQVEGKSE